MWKQNNRVNKIATHSKYIEFILYYINNNSIVKQKQYSKQIQQHILQEKIQALPNVIAITISLKNTFLI